MQTKTKEKVKQSFLNARPFVEKELEALAGFKLRKKDDESVLNDKPDPDRGALSHLRQALGKHPNYAFTALRYVAKWTENFEDEWDVESYYLVASLFALYQRGELSQSWHHDENLFSKEKNFGASFRRLELERQKKNREAEPKKERAKSLEKRFTALLNSRSADLAVRLRQAVLLLKSYEVPIDWVQLLQDLLRWKRFETFSFYHRKGISPQRKWAQSFWRIDDSESIENQPSKGGQN